MNERFKIYWAVRTEILDALKANDDERVRELAVKHPEIFTNVVNQAKNSLRRRR